MGGIFGVASKNSCTLDLFFGVDYHSHLGTKRGGMAVYGANGFARSIHLSLIHILLIWNISGFILNNETYLQFSGCR